MSGPISGVKVVGVIYEVRVLRTKGLEDILDKFTFFLFSLSLLILNKRKLLGFPGSSDGEDSACSVGDLDLIPGWGRFPWRRDRLPLQCSGLENSMDSSPWGHKELDMTEQLSLHFNLFFCYLLVNFSK